jgi:perosamine synthetase
VIEKADSQGRRVTITEPEIGTVLGVEELEAIRAALCNRKQSLSWGEEVAAFEQDFAAYCGVQYAFAVSSCTAALDLCAEALRLGPGDEVIATPQTFWSTIRALVARGVKIRFADIEPDTLNLDWRTVEILVTERTKAIYVVHYGGNPADLDSLRAIARHFRIALVEDCAHAPGARFRGTPIGSGELCCFSFQSYKNITTLGEGGMVTTGNPELANRLHILRSVGVLGEYRRRTESSMGPYQKPDFDLMDHSFGSWDFDLTDGVEVGSNRRMAAIPAAVGRVQLRKLDALNSARRRVAERYDALVSRIAGLDRTRVREGDTSAWHLYTCFLAPEAGVNRNELLRFMQEERGIRMVLRYWPLHLQSVLRSAGHTLGECPVCERVWFERQINLPMGPELDEGTIATVVGALAEGMKRCR